MLEKYINDKYGEVLDKFNLYENKDSIKLSLIVIKENMRERGIGSKIMRDIVTYADSNNKIIVLTPSTDYGSDKQRLIKFYRSFGFLMNRGYNEDPRFSDTMIRYPRNMFRYMKENTKPFIKKLLRETLINKFL